MEGTAPTVFISYSHADKETARAFAEGLEANGLTVWIDDNELLAGDSLIEQIAEAVAGVDFFCALVSPASRESNWCRKELSLAVSGMLGREGTTVMPLRVGDVEMPDSLHDVLYVDIDPHDVTCAVGRITRDVRRHRERRQRHEATAGTQGGEPAVSPAARVGQTPLNTEYEPLRIVGIVKEGVGKPRNDGTRGSGLYRVPLRLSRQPSALWSRLFSETWNHPPQFTTMHRPGIASVSGDTVVLDGTTLGELERYHVETLGHVIAKVNDDVRQAEDRERVQLQRQQALEEKHRREVDDVADRLRFD